MYEASARRMLKMAGDKMKRNRSARIRIVWIFVLGVYGFLAILSGFREHAVPTHRLDSQAQYALAQGYHVNVAAGSLFPPPEDAVVTEGVGNRFSWHNVLRILLWGLWTGVKIVGGLLKIVVAIIVMCVVGLGFA